MSLAEVVPMNERRTNGSAPVPMDLAAEEVGTTYEATDFDMTVRVITEADPRAAAALPVPKGQPVSVDWTPRVVIALSHHEPMTEDAP